MTDLQHVADLWKTWSNNPPSLLGAEAANTTMALVPEMVKEIERLRKALFMYQKQADELAVRW